MKNKFGYFLWPHWKVVFKMLQFKKSCVQYCTFGLLCTVLQKKLFSNMETVFLWTEMTTSAQVCPLASAKMWGKILLKLKCKPNFLLKGKSE